jgi:hypothetical protein
VIELTLSGELANRLAELPLAGIVREYPNAPAVLLNGPEDLQTPKKLHPAFYGCYDWHSAVHGFWSLARLSRLYSLNRAREVRAVFDNHLTAENIFQEVEYFQRPNRKTFERPYGWAWFLKLALELRSWDIPEAPTYRAALRPLEALIVDRFIDFLPRQTYPVQNGVHTNSAFSMVLALEYAEAVGNRDLADLLRSRAVDYFAEPALGIEPNGADFLSPSLTMAALMAKVIPPPDFGIWLGNLFPTGIPERLRSPVHVSDRTDPHIGHLDGLNLSRAWCYRRVAKAIDGEKLKVFADEHLRAAQVETGDYGGEHWLATFAILALTDN